MERLVHQLRKRWPKVFASERGLISVYRLRVLPARAAALKRNRWARYSSPSRTTSRPNTANSTYPAIANLSGGAPRKPPWISCAVDYCNPENPVHHVIMSNVGQDYRIFRMYMIFLGFTGLL